MHLEFHQFDLRWEHLRVREPHRQRQLLGSLAESGQQTPIVVVLKEGNADYLVIEGYKRIAALKQLGRDTVEATVWPMDEAEALLLSRAQRTRDAEWSTGAIGGPDRSAFARLLLPKLEGDLHGFQFLSGSSTMPWSRCR